MLGQGQARFLSSARGEPRHELSSPGDSHAVEPSRGAFLTRARRLFREPRAPRWIILLSLLLCAAALPTGMILDDSFHEVALQKGPVSVGSHEAPWNLFAFAKDPASVKRFMDQGVFPWWSDVNGGFSFLRPLASLTHWLDHQLWPSSMLLKHAHSLLWYGLLLGVVLLVYRRFGGSAVFPALALAIFAWDDARAMTVGWVANRSALMGLTFGFGSLLAHDSFRTEGKKRWLALALGLLAIGFFCAETTLQALGYLAAYALFREQGSLRKRLLSLVPYFVLMVAWRVLYTQLHYGSAQTDLYIDAGTDPLRFLQVALARMPVLLTAQFWGVFAETADMVKYASEPASKLVLWVCLIDTAVLIWLVSPLVRARSDVRFWAAGTLLATVPVCAVTPADRLLTGTGLGGAALVAILLIAASDRVGAFRGRVRGVVCAVLAVINLVIAPVLLPLRAHGLSYLNTYIARPEASLPDGPEVAHKTIILLNPATDEYGIYVPFHRRARGGVMPERFRWLANGDSELTVTRLDERSLKIRPQLGFLPPGSLWTVRSREKHSFVGETIELTGTRFEVTDVTPDGRPAEIVVRFEHPLESERYVWMQWDRLEYKPFVPPAPGKTVVVPRVDFETLLFGF